jgi:CHASE3 domain sensor protein
MFENLTVNKRLSAGFGLAAFTLLLVAGISYHNANILIDTERLANTHPSSPHRTRRPAVGAERRRNRATRLPTDR